MEKKILSDCEEWIKNKNINPITKRKITNTGAIYKKLMKECIIDKDINKSSLKSSLKSFKSVSKSSLKLSSKSSPPKITYYNKIMSYFRKKDEIQQINIKEHDRNDKYIKIMNYFKDIKLKDEDCIHLTKIEKKYILNNNIGLYKQIGTPSVYGVVYKSGNINKSYSSIPKFVVKIQLNTSTFKHELNIIKKIMNLNNIPLLPIIYKIIICNKLIKDDRYPEPIKKATKINKKYTLILYELANGDLNSFLEKKQRDYNIWKNCYEQIFMSIFLYHSMIGYPHFDTHSGNFLYRKIKPGGCFCYNINGINYYIENLGYVWMIWDYGNSEATFKTLYDETWAQDYMQLNVYMRHRDLKIENSEFYIKNRIQYYGQRYDNYGKLNEKIKITPDIYKLQEKIAEHMYYKTYKTNNYYGNKFSFNKNGGDSLTEYQWFKMMLDNNLLFSKTPIGEVISTTVFTNPNKFYYSDKLLY